MRKNLRFRASGLGFRGWCLHGDITAKITEEPNRQENGQMCANWAYIGIYGICRR